MAEDFEKAKQSFIDGMNRYLEYMRPILTLGHSMKVLGITEALGDDAEDDNALYNADIWDLALTNFLSQLKEAKNKDDVVEAVKAHREFLKRLF
jgi:hypothetical protein